MITKDVEKCIDESVLCWLATTSGDGMPNVSPKEVFAKGNGDTLVIAHIASPKSYQNLQTNSKACVSFINIFVQKGYKLSREIRLVKKSDVQFSEVAKPLVALTKGKFPISAVMELTVKQVDPIIAPKYKLFPDTTEAMQIESAMETYGVAPQK